MTYLNIHPAYTPHVCVVPAVNGVGLNSVWRCDDCNATWRMTHFFIPWEHLDWHRNKSGYIDRPLPWWDSARHAVKRAPEPSTDDLRRIAAVEQLLDDLDIDPVNLVNVRFNNPSAAAPYHGFQHLITTALNVHAGAVAENLDVQDERIVVLAALWHDFDHEGAKVPDADNINAAVSGFFSYDDSPNSIRQAVAAAIRATHVPGGIAATQGQKILRDADLLQCLEPDGPVFMAGLAAETGTIVTPESTREFLLKTELHTNWAKTIVAQLPRT